MPQTPHTSGPHRSADRTRRASWRRDPSSHVADADQRRPRERVLCVPFSAEVLRVFIASPGDVPADRDEVEATIHEWNRQHAVRQGIVLLPQRWEGAAAHQGGDGQRQVNEQQVADSDIVIAIFHTRLGSPTPRSVSGTAEEIEVAIELEKSTHILVSRRQLDPLSIDQEEFARLRGYLYGVQASGLTKNYEDAPGLRREVNNALWLSVDRFNRRPPQPVEPTADPSVELPSTRPTPRYASNLGAILLATQTHGFHDKNSLDDGIRALKALADTLAQVGASARAAFAVLVAEGMVDSTGVISMEVDAIASDVGIGPLEAGETIAELERFGLVHLTHDATGTKARLADQPGNLYLPLWSGLRELERISPGVVSSILADLEFDRLDARHSRSIATAGSAEGEGPGESSPGDIMEQVPQPSTSAQRIRVETELRAEQGADPVARQLAQVGHLYLVAIPEGASAHLGRSLVRGSGADFLRSAIARGERRLDQHLQKFHPGAQLATAVRKATSGIALESLGPDGHAVTQSSSVRSPGPEVARAERGLVSISLREDASVRVLAGRLTDTDPRDQTWILDGLAIAYACRIVRYAQAVANETHYTGAWLFGMLGTDLRGNSSSALRDGWNPSAPFGEDEYMETVAASGSALRESGADVVRELCGGLTYVLGTTEHFDGLIRASFQ